MLASFLVILACYSFGQSTTTIRVSNKKIVQVLKGKDVELATPELKIPTGSNLEVFIENGSKKLNLHIRYKDSPQAAPADIVLNPDPKPEDPGQKSATYRVESAVFYLDISDPTATPPLLRQLQITPLATGDEKPYKLDLGYAITKLTNSSFHIETPNPQTNPATFNIVENPSKQWTDSAVLFVHFLGSRNMSHRLLGWLLEGVVGYEPDEYRTAFTFGLPAPGSATPAKYFAGMSVLFGRNRDIAATFGLAFGDVQRLQPGAVVTSANATVPTVSKFIGGFFIGLSYRLPG